MIYSYTSSQPSSIIHATHNENNSEQSSVPTRDAKKGADTLYAAAREWHHYMYSSRAEIITRVRITSDAFFHCLFLSLVIDETSELAQLKPRALRRPSFRIVNIA